MGEKEKIVRLVLDTNVLVSALLFRSEASEFLDAWYGGNFRLAVSKEILGEYRRVLAYPKFRLSERETVAIMEHYVLPFCDRFEPKDTPRVCADPDDDKFFHCASAAHAALVSGDRAVLALGSRHGRIRILTVAAALALLRSGKL